MRIDRDYNAVIETQREKEIMAEAVNRLIADKEDAEQAAWSCCETKDAEILEKEIAELYEIWTLLDRAIRRQG